MALVMTKDMLIKARKNHYAIGAFEVWSIDSVQAVIEAAQDQKMPVILQISPLEVEFAGISHLAMIARSLASEATVPVALHLDHAVTFDLVCRALDVGFTSVMIDASCDSFKNNVVITKKVVDQARKYGASVESELGSIGGSETGNADLDFMQTDPEEARLFVEETTVDSLAVSIGTVHGFYRFKPNINIGRLADIARMVSLPLVLHGGSGTPDDQIVMAIKNGIAKVNIYTEFVAAMGKAYTSAQQADGFKYNVPYLFGAGKIAGKTLVANKIRLFS